MNHHPFLPIPSVGELILSAQMERRESLRQEIRDLKNKLRSMKPKYNPLPLLLHAWDTYYPRPHKVESFLNRRLLELGHCIECNNTGHYTRYEGPIAQERECDNCK